MSRLLIEIIAGLLLTGGFVGWWIYHDHVEQKEGIAIQVKTETAAATKQKAIDDKILQEATNAHTKEISDLKNAYLTPVSTLEPVVCYYQAQPSSVPEANIHSSPSTAPVVVQDNSQLHRDIAAAFELLFKRADGLSADARQLEQETHADH